MEQTINKQGNKDIENVADGLRLIYQKYGKQLFAEGKKLYALLADIMPTKEKELKILKIACNAGVYKGFVDLEENQYDNQRRKAIKILTDDYLLGLEWAEMAIDWLMETLGIKQSPPIIKKEKSKQKQVKIQANADFDITRTGKLRAYYGSCQEVIIPEESIDDVKKMIYIKKNNRI
ncbi:MAG: hypothetical protein ACI4SH_03020 [Candidatus Scatosoma sp.]